MGTWKLFRLAVWAGLSWAGLSWAGAHCQPSSSAPGGWLALGWGNMATRLRVSQHPAGRPVLVCTQTWKASKSSKWASTHAEALCKVLLVSCLQMPPWPKQVPWGMLMSGVEKVTPRSDGRSRTSVQGHTHTRGTEGWVAIVTIHHRC